jgi:hypothetical protein
VVKWSELTQAGSRPAIQIKVRFSKVANRLVFDLSAGLNDASEEVLEFAIASYDDRQKIKITQCFRKLQVGQAIAFRRLPFP